MNKIVIALTAFFPFLINAQISINSVDMANAGDTVRVTNSSDFSLDFLSTGADFDWDFSSLTGDSQEVIEYTGLDNAGMLINVVFGTFAPADYQASYHQPSTDLPLDQIGGVLPVDLSEIERYSKISTDDFNLVGYSLTVEGNTIPFKSDTIETKYEFPMTFGDNFSSRGYSDINLSPAFEGRFVQYAQRTVDVDGWGSLITPFGTFDVVRVHHTVTETDSIEMELGGFPVSLELPIPDKHIYEWWANGEKEPVLKVEFNTIGGNDVVTSVVYRDDIDADLVANIEEQNLNNLNVFPNPASEVIKVENIEIATSYILVNANGSIVREGQFLSENNQIDIADFKSGNYQLILKSADSLRIESILKK